MKLIFSRIAMFKSRIVALRVKKINKQLLRRRNIHKKSLLGVLYGLVESIVHIFTKNDAGRTIQAMESAIAL